MLSEEDKDWIKATIEREVGGAMVLLAILVFVCAFVGCAAPASGYDVQATFDAVPGAESYIVNVGETMTAIVPGGNPYVSTTVTVQAVGLGRISGESNAIEIPPLATECERMDLDNDGSVTASDLLTLMLTVQGEVCE